MKRFVVRFSVRSVMVLVGSLAILMGVVLFLQRTSEASQRDICRSNLLSIGLGLMNYTSLYEVFPVGTVPNEKLVPEKRLSWLANLSGLFQQLLWLLNLSEPWDSMSNRITRCHGVEEEPMAVGKIGTFCCPAAPGASREHMPGWTWYVGIAGVGKDAPNLPAGHPRAGVFGYDRQIRFDALKDGSSTTMMLAETGQANGPWTAGGASTVRGLDPDRLPYLGRDRQFGGFHRGGAMVAMADGSVRFLRETINPKVFEAISTVAGGEKLPADWDR